MRTGRRLAVDVGKVRIGIAICDREAILSSPLEAVARLSSASETVTSIAQLADTHGVIEVYVGDPLSLSGKETDSTNDARFIASELSKTLEILESALSYEKSAGLAPGHLVGDSVGA
jgi:putative Holliday junction resolvase